MLSCFAVSISLLRGCGPAVFGGWRLSSSCPYLLGLLFTTMVAFALHSSPLTQISFAVALVYAGNILRTPNVHFWSCLGPLVCILVFGVWGALLFVPFLSFALCVDYAFDALVLARCALVRWLAGPASRRVRAAHVHRLSLYDAVLSVRACYGFRCAVFIFAFLVSQVPFSGSVSFPLSVTAARVFSLRLGGWVFGFCVFMVFVALGIDITAASSVLTYVF